MGSGGRLIEIERFYGENNSATEHAARRNGPIITLKV
jgi:hypothetical protein